MAATVDPHIERLRQFAKETQGADTLSWAKEHKYLSVRSFQMTDDVIHCIPKGGKVFLHDVSVKPPKVKKAMRELNAKGKNPNTDDAVYASDEEIRRRVPRGLSLMQIDDPISGETIVFPAIFAMSKFTGGMGDEDEDDPETADEWKRFFIKPIDDMKSVLMTSKENGEAAHFSAVKLWGGVKVLVCGSKKVHLAFSSTADLDQPCFSDGRFMVAKQVANTVVKLLKSELNQETTERLLNHLADNFFTATFEILQPTYMHVEFFDFEEPRLKFIAFTKSPLVAQNNQSDGLCIMPLKSLSFAKEIGLDTITYEEYPGSKLDEVMTNIRNGYGKEGSVLYFLDADGNVIGLLKKKTVWYIVLRALREKVKGMVARIAKAKKEGKLIPDSQHVNNSSPLSILKERTAANSRITKRLSELQKWLEFTDECKEAWSKLSIGFAEWVSQALYKPEGSPEYENMVNGIRSVFPKLWNDYLREKNLSDRIAPFA